MTKDRTDILDRQRIDKWLWHARVVRTRSAASALASAGRVRINGVRVNAPSRSVRAGDTVTVGLDRVSVLKVLGFAEKRGAAPDAAMICEDLEPALPEAAQMTQSVRDTGSGRPSKRERRAIVSLKHPRHI